MRLTSTSHCLLVFVFCLVSLLINLPRVNGDQLLAGTAKADITNYEAGPVNDPLYAKALVLKSANTTAVLITVDAVAIGEIGYIGNEYLGGVRTALREDLGIAPESVLINASHCHGVVSADVQQKTILAVKDAFANLVPVRVGAGTGSENRIMENRRLRLTDGSEADVRHAYSMPRDQDVAAIGPIDPQIGLLRIDRLDGRPLAAVYNFACHPIQGVASRGNTADFPAFASRVIEENLGDHVMAFFVQGCAGDINPVLYKDVHQPRDSEPFGNQLGLSAMRGLRAISTEETSELKIVNRVLALPRATDFERRMAAITEEQTQLLKSLRGTSLNFKTFVPLFVQYKVSGDFPAYYSHRYLQEKAIGRDDLVRMDAENRANMDAYLANIETMEKLTRLQTNLNLLKMHHEQTIAAGKPTLDAEVVGLRVGSFVLVTFPGELTVQIGLNIKKASPHPMTFVAGYTNGYIYYTPTADQRNNSGYAQEDCDTLIAPEWQAQFESFVGDLLKGI